MSKTKYKGNYISLFAMLLITLLFIGLAVCLIPTVHAAEEDVTTWTACGSCEWGIDPDGCLWIRPIDGVSGTLASWQQKSTAVPWHSVRSSVRSVVVKPGVSAQECAYMFYGMESCTSYDLSGLDTSSAARTVRMFDYPVTFDSAALSGYKTVKGQDSSIVIIGGDNLFINKGTSAFSNFGPFWGIDVWTHTDPATGIVETKTGREMSQLEQLGPGQWVLNRSYSSSVDVLEDYWNDGNCAPLQHHDVLEAENGEISYSFVVPENNVLYSATNVSPENYWYDYGEQEQLGLNLASIEQLNWVRVNVPADRTIAGTMSEYDEFIVYKMVASLYTIDYVIESGHDRSNTYYTNQNNVLINESYKNSEGKYLVGWNTSADGTGTHYDLGDIIPANTYEYGDTLTLYAEWGDEPLYDGWSILSIMGAVDMSDISSMIPFMDMEYDGDNDVFHIYDADNNEQQQADGAYEYHAMNVDGYRAKSVYVCTNAYDLISGMITEDEMTWALTTISPQNISGTLNKTGDIKFYVILYEVIDPNVTEFNAALVLDQNASVPNASVAFTAAPGVGVAAVPGTSLEVLAPTAENGVTGTPTVGSAAFAAGDATVTSVDGVTVGANQKAVVKPVSIDFNGVTFAQPGVFRYLITEPSSGSGLTYDTQLGDSTNGVRYQRVLDVYVQRVDDADTGATSYQIGGYVFHEVANAPAVGATVAADKSSGFVHEYDTKTVTLESRAAGNQSSIDKYFAYTITVQNPNNSAFTVSADWTNAADALNPTANPATKYDAATITAANTAEWTSNADGSLSKTIYLRNGQKVELDGIPAGATYAISVADEDYSPSWVIGSDNGTTNATGNRVLNAMEDVVFTLTREGVVPTGVMLSAVPGLIIMTGALIAIVVTRKRKEGQAEA